LVIQEQYKILIDIIKNHSPKYIVIDELHTKKGVNMIASVHGNLNELIYNNDLNEVLGGIHSTILSGNQDRKMRTEKDKISSFDIIIQINYNGLENRYEYTFIENIDDTIDRILNKKYYN
jgi:stage III sporulation protein SpoIIIAA